MDSLLVASESAFEKGGSEKVAANKHDSTPLPSLSSSETAGRSVDDDYPEGGREAWLVVLGSFCGLTASFGLLNSAGVFQAHLRTHQLAGYSDDQIGWIFGFYNFLSFFCGVQIGPTFDRYGPRWLVAAGTVLLVGGTLAVASSTEYWHFMLSYALCLGLGTSLIFTPAVAAVAHFFVRRRGFATGFAMTGGSIGGIIFPLALPPLIDAIGFVQAVRCLALMFLALLLAANVLIRSRLPPLIPPPSILPDLRIFSSLTFSLTTAGVFAMELAIFVPITYLPAAAISTGLAPRVADLLPALLNAGSFFGRWMPGYVADRAGRFNSMLVSVAASAIVTAAIWLPTGASFSSSTSSTAALALNVTFALLFGFTSGSNISLTPVCVGQLCDTASYGRHYATCNCVVAFGCLTGVPLAGALLRSAGVTGAAGFTMACYVAGFFFFAAARVRVVGWAWRRVF